MMLLWECGNLAFCSRFPHFHSPCSARPAFNTRTDDAGCVSVYSVAGVRLGGRQAVTGQLDAPVPPRELE